MATTVNAANGSSRPHHTLWGDAWVRLRRNKLAMAGGIFIIILALAAIFAPLITPYGFAHQDLTAILQNPSSKHWLGTDGLGRDVFARLLYGARTSLAVGIFTQVIVLGIGLPIGAIAGYAGGRVDNVLMRFVDVMYGFPDILLNYSHQSDTRRRHLSIILRHRVGGLGRYCPSGPGTNDVRQIPRFC